MARIARLKVFRTPIGFHDAYVAAPSQKAALEAWGSDHDLFARGEAELVTDEALTREPLAAPGKVIKRLRATADEQFAALGKGEGRSPKARRAPSKVTRNRAPRPGRDALDQADAVLMQAEQRHKRERREIADEEARLVRRRRDLEREQTAERARLDRERDEARRVYERKLEEWRSGS